MSNGLLNKIEKFLIERNILNDETHIELKEGVEKLNKIRGGIDSLVLELKRSILDNSVHLLQERVMNENKEGVIEILDNSRNVVDYYDFLEKMENLINEYSKYKLFYDEHYPELHEIKTMLALKDDEVINIVKEIVTKYDMGS